MKLTRLLPPVIALVLAVAWIGNQRRSISSLERASTILEKAIATRASGSLTDSASTKQLAAAKSAEDKKPLDWRKIAAEFVEFYGKQGVSDRGGIIKLHKHLRSLSKEELIAALDEISALDLPEESRVLLENFIIMPLARIDPELVMNRFIDRTGDLGYLLSHPFGEWAKKNPASAVAWFDQQIAAGKFDSKSLDARNVTRLHFEGSLINSLLSSDPESAERRLAALPQDQRSQALGPNSSDLVSNTAHQLAYAKIVRSQILKKNQPEVLSQKAGFLVQMENYSKVTEFLDRIKATPVERTACVEEAVRSKIQNITSQKKITRMDLDTMREWVNSQAPDSIGTVTGKALASVTYDNHKLGFSEAAELAVEYNTANGNDDVLCSFLECGFSAQYNEQVRSLAAKIRDPKRRAETLKKFE